MWWFGCALLHRSGAQKPEGQWTNGGSGGRSSRGCALFPKSQSAIVAAGVRTRGLPAGRTGESEQEHHEDQFEQLPLPRKMWSGMKMKKLMHIDEL